MKALSIRQPWAWAILHGKPVENRSWQTRFRGPFLIHAGKRFDRKGYLWLSEHRGLLTAELPKPTQFPMGGIVGKSTLTDCVNKHESSFFFGPYGFLLKNSGAVPFTPCKGRLGFFYIPDDVIIHL